MHNQYLSKFNLIRLLEKDKETKEKVKEITKKYKHNITILFLVGNDTREIRFNLVNDRKEEYTKNEFNELLHDVYKVYELNLIPALSSIGTKNSDLLLVLEFHINDTNYTQIGINSIVFKTQELDEIVLNASNVNVLDDFIEVV